jgi:uncharacterized protein
VPFDTFQHGAVRGFLHPASSDGHSALVLTHGAGADATAPVLILIAEAFSAAGVSVLRCNLAFRDRRPHGPPFPAQAAADRERLREATNAVRGVGATRVFLGGHSYGGRQATMLAAESPEVAGALLLLSYPLHPPRKPENRRAAHLPSLTTPAFFVHGTRDPLGTPAELREAIALIPAATRLIEVEGAGHDLRSKLTAGAARALVEEFLAFAGCIT